MSDSSSMSAADRDSNNIIESQLDKLLLPLEQAAAADILSYLGPIEPPADDQIKEAVEGIKNKRKSMLVFLETEGGYITVAERIARILRYHYGNVEFIVPTYAMSAGTVLVMSGDAIHMNYASTLGPIDPQVKKKGEDLWVPALGYLQQYERLVDKSAQGTLTTAELAYLIRNFDPAELYRYEQERELSIALLKDWLVKYKFKDWKITETQKIKVTKKLKTERAQEIAKKLNDTDEWHSHSRGIAMETLIRKLKLRIDDYEKNEEMASAIAEYFKLLEDYRMRRGHWGFVLHTQGRHVGY